MYLIIETDKISTIEEWSKITKPLQELLDVLTEKDKFLVTLCSGRPPYILTSESEGKLKNKPRYFKLCLNPTVMLASFSEIEDTIKNAGNVDYDLSQTIDGSNIIRCKFQPKDDQNHGISWIETNNKGKPLEEGN